MTILTKMYILVELQIKKSFKYLFREFMFRTIFGKKLVLTLKLIRRKPYERASNASISLLKRITVHSFQTFFQKLLHLWYMFYCVGISIEKTLTTNNDIDSEITELIYNFFALANDTDKLYSVRCWSVVKRNNEPTTIRKCGLYSIIIS